MSGREAVSSGGICEGAAAYALGSLADDEIRAFTAHLNECLGCRDQVEAFEAVVDALPMAAPQFRPPERLRREVIRAMRQESRSRTDGRWRPGSRPVLGPMRGLVVGALAASAAVAAAVFAAVVLTSPRSAARVIHARVIGSQGQAEVALTGGRSVLIVHRLAPPAPGHVYEVWLQQPGRPPAPADVLFSVTPSGDADLGLPRSVRTATALLVTQEPDQGSPAPTSGPVIVAHLT